MIRTLRQRRTLVTRNQRKASLVLLACTAIVLFCVPAFADPTSTPGSVTVKIDGWDGTDWMHYQTTIPINEDGSFSAQDLTSNDPNWWGGQFSNISGNSDPFTSMAYGVTNFAAVPVEFTFSVMLPITPIAGATLHGGSIGGSVNDANANGVGGLTTITSVPGTPFYSGQIDGVGVLSLYPDVTSFPITSLGEVVPFGTSLGLPGITLPSGPALVSIGIVNRFKLSPGDGMSATSFFIVVPNPIPEPSTIVLAGLAGVALAWHAARRRRS